MHPFFVLFCYAEKYTFPGECLGSHFRRQFADTAYRIAALPGPVNHKLIYFSGQDFEIKVLVVNP